MHHANVSRNTESSWLLGQNTTYVAALLTAKTDLGRVRSFRRILEQYWPAKQARDAHEFYVGPPPGTPMDVVLALYLPRPEMPSDYQAKRDDLLRVLPEAKRVVGRCCIEIGDLLDRIVDSTMGDVQLYERTRSIVIQAEGACEQRYYALRHRCCNPWTWLRDMLMAAASLPVQIAATLGADPSKAAHLVVIRVVQTVWGLIFLVALLVLFGKRATEQVLPGLLKLLGK